MNHKIVKNYIFTLFVTLCIACFEMCQCIVQAKADKYNNKIMEEMECNKKIRH